jgi:hypothetical protein
MNMDERRLDRHIKQSATKSKGNIEQFEIGKKTQL